MQKPRPAPSVAIACGGTGGHLFPGLAVAEELNRRDCRVSLLISPREVDQQSVRQTREREVVTLPAVGLTRGGFFRFARGFAQSYFAARKFFQSRRPAAVLSMGGFTAAPPVLAGRRTGAKTFLHESNTIPGRANRWLAHFVDEGFVYFHEASGRMNLARIHLSGMPVRSQFLEPVDPASARVALGLKPHKPVLLVMGGSQGASALNELITETLPRLAPSAPGLQFLHLTGANDWKRVEAAYATQKLTAVVRPFLTEMELALGAATLAVSRAGASSLAELAAMRVPAILIPYPTAADDHQFHNARAFVDSGAARMLEQKPLAPERLAEEIAGFLVAEDELTRTRCALEKWRTPAAAEKIAVHILDAIAENLSPALGTSLATSAPSRDEAGGAGSSETGWRRVGNFNCVQRSV